MRKILHVDMDAFYASVEQRDRLELRGRPVAVGGDSERGVILTASYEARRFGVGSAMPTRRALRLCPELVVVPPRFDAYRQVSGHILAIFQCATDLVEPLALDEAYLDVTEPKRGPASATLQAQRIKAEILERTGLTASAGVSTGKFLAKMASGVNKPDGLTVIPPDRADTFLASLRIERFHGVGPRTAARLRAIGVHTGADLRALDPADLERMLGKAGRFLSEVVRGIDDRPVQAHRQRKSLGSETTFDRDRSARCELEPVLDRLSTDLAERLERLQLTARTVTVKVRYPDFTVCTRSRTLPSDVADAAAIIGTARVLAFASDRPAGPVRLLGVTVSQLRPRERHVVQPSLPFEPRAS